jgi:hypothetical protein
VSRVRTRYELRELGWVRDDATMVWTAPDGTTMDDDHVRDLRHEGRLPGNQQTKRAAAKERRRKRKQAGQGYVDMTHMAQTFEQKVKAEKIDG